jgi:DNA invertase Pin-like site-specific DNA recombinase
LVGVAKGGVGSVESFFGKDIPEIARAGSLAAQEKLDLISPAERAQRSAQPLYQGLTPEQESGKAAPFSGLPTYKGVTEDFRNSAESRSFPLMSYESKTTPGKIVNTAAEYAMQGAPGAVRGLAGRMVTGAGAGAGSEIGALSAQNPDEMAYNKIVGSLTGAGAGAIGSSIAGKIVGGLKALVSPGSAAERELADMIAQDIRRGQSGMTIEQMQEAAARGAPVTIMDAASPETRKRLGMMAEKSSSAEEAGGRYNEFLRERAQGSADRVSEGITSAFGRPVNAPQSEAMAKISGKQQRDEVYDFVRDPSNTAAQYIDQSAFSGLLNRPTFQKAMKDAEKSAKDLPEYGIRPPQTVDGRLVYGNLSYWDQVKRELDKAVSMAERSGDNVEITKAVSAKKELLKSLDEVPGYAKARGVAVETFGAQDAPQAGLKFFNNMDAFKRSEAKNAFESMSDGQKELFREGFAHRMNELAQEGRIGELAKKFQQPAFRDRAMMVLGPERYSQINATVLSENLLSKAKQLQFVQQSRGIGPASMVGAAGAALTDAVVWGGQLGTSPEQLIKLAIGATVGAAGKVAMNAMERRIASNVLPLAVSTDPKDLAKLATMIQASPATAQVLGKFTTALSNTISASESAGRATGGRAGRATGGRVGVNVESDALVRAAERAKKDFNRTTEPLLNTSDNHIAKALEVANKAI